MPNCSKGKKNSHQIDRLRCSTAKSKSPNKNLDTSPGILEYGQPTNQNTYSTLCSKRKMDVKIMNINSPFAQKTCRPKSPNPFSKTPKRKLKLTELFAKPDSSITISCDYMNTNTNLNSFNDTLPYTSNAVVLQERPPSQVRISRSREGQRPITASRRIQESHSNAALNKKPAAIMMPKMKILDHVYDSGCGSGFCLSPKRTNTFIQLIEKIETRRESVNMEAVKPEKPEEKNTSSKSVLQVIERSPTTPSADKRKSIKGNHVRKMRSISNPNSKQQTAILHSNTFDSIQHEVPLEKTILSSKPKQETKIQCSVVDMNSATNMSANRLKYMLLIAGLEKKYNRRLLLEYEELQKYKASEYRSNNHSFSTLKDEPSSPKQPQHSRKLSAKKENLQIIQEKIIKSPLQKGRVLKIAKNKDSFTQ